MRINLKITLSTLAAGICFAIGIYFYNNLFKQQKHVAEICSYNNLMVVADLTIESSKLCQYLVKPYDPEKCADFYAYVHEKIGELAYLEVSLASISKRLAMQQHQSLKKLAEIASSFSSISNRCVAVLVHLEQDKDNYAHHIATAGRYKAEFLRDWVELNNIIYYTYFPKRPLVGLQKDTKVLVQNKLITHFEKDINDFIRTNKDQGPQAAAGLTFLDGGWPAVFLYLGISESY